MDLSNKNLQCKLWFILDLMLQSRVSKSPIILSGFWRSGTTWIQQVIAESVCAKTQFEPLEPNALLPLHGGANFDLIQGAYIPLTWDVFSEKDCRFLDLAFKGVSPKRSGFNYLARTSFKECFADRVVVKFVRAQFILPVLMQRYGAQGVIHISRHPMAVIQSLMNAKWEWDFADIDLSDLYWRENELSICPLWEELKVYKNASKEEKIAALWALSEREVRKSENIFFVKYEELLKEPDIGFANLLKTLGLQVHKEVDYSKDSPVTALNRVGASLEERLNSWRTNMPHDTQIKVRAVLRNLWPEVDNEWELG
ncbi:sulfotransferase [Neptuniibacter marinus]|uniref:sulfotransferase n=1 Tax=Neptuniibacter marinus TaxID=1806670 RepID=UPI00082BB420|nr:sulfotransferase [Neptuniibacter marinus]